MNMLDGTGPRRVLIVSADIGQGHNATGRALEEAARRRWPGCEVTWVDTLQVMHAGPAFRRIYVANVESTPWLYDFFYDRIWRYRWFARSSKRFTSEWAGRLLEPVVEAADPDVVLSTYPIGSGGLAWLRRHRGLDVPIGAWVSDFAPHPFWVYDELDLHVVMHEECVPLALRAEPHARVVATAAPPVVGAFRPRDRADARTELAARGVPLRADAFVALVSCGAFGFGEVEEAVDALLGLDDARLQVVVACGRNERMRERLRSRGAGEDRLVALGWTEDMPLLAAASDVVVTNAGGATGLEALASGRTVLMFRPIAGHGRPNAEAMAQAGLALLCPEPEDLTRTVAELLADPARLRASEEAALAYATAGRVDDDLARLLEAAGREQGTPRHGHGHGPPPVRRHAAPPPMGREDAFFVHVDTERVGQEVGAVVVADPAGPPLRADDVRDRLAAALPWSPWLDWRLRREPGRRPRWVPGALLGGPPPVEVVRAGASLAEAAERFLREPLRPEVRAWRLAVVEGDEPGLVLKAHHAAGDGLAILDVFGSIAAPRPDAPPAARPAAASRPETAPGRPAPRARRDLAAAARRRGAELGVVARGLLSLARSGPAPHSALSGARSGTSGTRHAFVPLPDKAARAAARRYGCGTTELLVAVVAEATHRFLLARGAVPPGGALRAMVPRTARRAPSRADVRHGNRTAASSVDIPVGALPPHERVSATVSALRRSVEHGEPQAAYAVMQLAGLLPAPLHALAARGAYRSTWFNLIVSVIPGPRAPRYVGAARLREVYPVLPLAEGVGLAVGVLAWDETLGACVTWDPELVPDGAEIADRLREAFDAVVGADAAGGGAGAAEEAAVAREHVDGGAGADGAAVADAGNGARAGAASSAADVRSRS